MIYNDILYRKLPFLVSKITPIPRSRVTLGDTRQFWVCDSIQCMWFNPFIPCFILPLTGGVCSLKYVRNSDHSDDEFGHGSGSEIPRKECDRWGNEAMSALWASRGVLTCSPATSKQVRVRFAPSVIQFVASADKINMINAHVLTDGLLTPSNLVAHPRERVTTWVVVSNLRRRTRCGWSVVF